MKRRDWYGEQRPEDDQPVDQRVRAALRSVGQVRRLATRISALTRRLSKTTTPEQLRLWLEIDEAQSNRLSLERAAYYNLGVEAGLAMREVDGMAHGLGRHRARPAEVIRVLALMLARTAKTLE
jgi:hypothetical protein